jgi:hypothetical protein
MIPDTDKREVIVLFRVDPRDWNPEDLNWVVTAFRDYCRRLELDPKARRKLQQVAHETRAETTS